jgi:hypothetical protein
MATGTNVLYEPITARTEVYAAASNSKISGREYDVIIEDMKKSSLSLDGLKSLAKSDNLLKWLEDRTQPLTDYILKTYPSASDDLAKHYACSRLMGEIFGTYVSAGIGLLKEISDAGGITGFSYQDLGANIAGFSGLTAQQAFDGGFITREAQESYTGAVEGSLLELCKKLLSFINSKIQSYSTVADKVWNWLTDKNYRYSESASFFSLLAIIPFGVSNWDMDSNLTVVFYGSEGTDATGTIIRSVTTPTRIALIRCNSGGRYPYGRPFGYRITGKLLGNENPGTYDYWDRVGGMYYASTKNEWNTQISTNFTGSDYDFAMGYNYGPINPFE